MHVMVEAPVTELHLPGTQYVQTVAEVAPSPAKLRINCLVLSKIYQKRTEIYAYKAEIKIIIIIIIIIIIAIIIIIMIIIIIKIIIIIIKKKKKKKKKTCMYQQHKRCKFRCLTVQRLRYIFLQHL